MDTLYQKVCRNCSKLVTRSYSTSFSLGIRVFHRRFRGPIYSIYGFVRLADEIVDTFHEKDKKYLLEQFRRDTRDALEHRISLNPILHSFQEVVHKYRIERAHIDAFLDSMAMDLEDTPVFDEQSYREYIYGSAEVVGLMCLKVFAEGNEALYKELEPHARSLGSAFQKVNFLRDIKSDYNDRGRVYFPGVDFAYFTDEDKSAIEADIQKDFRYAYEGIRKLPIGSRLGVYLAYAFYQKLFRKISTARAADVADRRIRISDKRKAAILLTSMLKMKLGRM